MISIGKPLGNCRIYILDESMRPLPVGAAGELYIGGDCLARGYHGDEELTRKKFVGDPYIPGERLYRTGDMGYWTQDGEIIFTGRKDGQLKILGHRMEPAEIEEKLVSHPKVDMAAVKAFDNLLVAYYTSKEGLTVRNFFLMRQSTFQDTRCPPWQSGWMRYRSLPTEKWIIKCSPNRLYRMSGRRLLMSWSVSC
ncbi:MAG: AMP-binding protein [Blautia marasmi]